MRLTQPEMARAHRMLTEWAEWYGRMLVSSRIGYPSHTAEARLLADGGARTTQPMGSRVPLVDCPRHLADVDRAMQQLPDDWRPAIYAEIFPPNEGEPRKPVELYRHRTGGGHKAFTRDRGLALAWIAAHLHRPKSECNETLQDNIG